MKQFLGSKKVRIIERLIGQPVRAALVRGGWDHFVAEVWLKAESLWIYRVNWKTGEWEEYSRVIGNPYFVKPRRSGVGLLQVIE